MKNRTKMGEAVNRLIALVGVLAAAGLVIAYMSGRSTGPAPSGASDSGPAVSASGEEVSAPNEFSRIEGRWLRPDGGYVLELGRVGGEGRVQARYLNPDPIHVSRAECSRDDEGIRLMVELQDTGYPGCIYDLRYRSNADRWIGTYYQAALRETFEVEFERME